MRKGVPQGDHAGAHTVQRILHMNLVTDRLAPCRQTCPAEINIPKYIKHIKIDLFSTLVPQKWRPVRELVLSIVCILISAIMLKVCTDYVKMEMEFGGTLFLNLPNWIGQLILPAGFALILFRFLVRAIDQGRQIGKGLTK